MAVLAQQLDDHLVDCIAERKRTTKSLDRIWGILLAVAGSAFLQLLAFAGWLFTHAYPPPH
jgi:hypothetical protein